MGHPRATNDLHDILALLDEGSGARQPASDSEILERVRQFNKKPIAASSTMQYACATLPGRQLGVDLPPEPFSSKQQRQASLMEASSLTVRRVELCFL